MTKDKNDPPPKLLPSEAGSKRPEADRRLRQADRLARILRLLQLLLSRARWNARELAAEQEVSERTIYRDRVVLELAGVPVDYDHDQQCYRMRPDFRFPVLNLGEEEALAQGMATAIAKGPGLGIPSKIRSVTEKLAAAGKEEIAQILTDASEVITILDLKLADHSRQRGVIQATQWALLRGKQLTGVYKSPYQKLPLTVQLHPYQLCLVKAAWYLIARPAEEEVPRTYRIARFRTLRMSEANAQVPDAFDLKSYFGNAWAVYRGDKRYDIELRFGKEAAVTATETIWHRTQKVRKNRDGSVSMTFQVDGLNEILRWVLGWGNRVKVIQPPELRDMVFEQLNECIRAYQS